MSNSTQNDWEKQLSKRFYNSDGTLHIGGERLRDMEQFIRTILADARREVIEKVEKLPVVDSSGLCDLIAKEDVLATLREEEK